MTLGVSPLRSPLEPMPSAPGSLPERLLLAGYGWAAFGWVDTGTERMAGCACGGSIDATFRAVPEAVADHNGTLEHRAWRAMREAT